MSSTTFDAQLNVASLVAHDNPHLYYEIQALNEYGYTSLNALRSAAERIQELIAGGDERGFVELMESGRKYLEKR
jgi:chorismate mutase/prephenate dehydrogenase